MEDLTPSSPRATGNLYWTRKTADLTQTEMGFMLSISGSEYGKLEAGYLDWEGYSTLACHMLGLQWEQLNTLLTEYNRVHRDRAVYNLLLRKDALNEIVNQPIEKLLLPELPPMMDAVAEDSVLPVYTPVQPLSLRIENGSIVLIQESTEIVMTEQDRGTAVAALRAMGEAL